MDDSPLCGIINKVVESILPRSTGLVIQVDEYHIISYSNILGGCPFNGPLSGMNTLPVQSPRHDTASPIKYNYKIDRSRA